MDSFPAVAALQALAADVRGILGPEVKIGYAADWSEYFGYQPADGSGDLLYHLDPLWADEAIDFVGIDNYMPLSDWRDGPDHADAGFGSIYDLEYLKANIEGGEGYDWYYPHAEARAAQLRVPITDGAYGHPWEYRPKGIRNWWARAHRNRIGGVQQAGYTPWEPRMKPVWFTEIGCPAVDKGTNQPNVFFDPKSSESHLPHHSSGARDDFVQTRYLQAMHDYWSDPAHNPVSPVYGGPMIETARMFVWAWDTRPWPAFPDMRDLWSDSANFGRGHWISGRVGMPSLATVVAEICQRCGVSDLDLRGLQGGLTGMLLRGDESARAALQPLMLAYGFECFEQDGRLTFRTRDGHAVVDLDPGALVLADPEAGALRQIRAPEAEVESVVRVQFSDVENSYQSGAVMAEWPGAGTPDVAQAQVPIALRSGEARVVAQRWLSEGRVARDRATFSLPPSALALGPGDVVALTREGVRSHYRIDRIEEAGLRRAEAVRVEPGVYLRRAEDDRPVSRAAPAAAGPVHAQVMDLPLQRPGGLAHAPHVVAAADPWPGAAAVYASADGEGFDLIGTLPRSGVTGRLSAALPAGLPGRWMRGPGLFVQLDRGELQARSTTDVLNGANLAALRGPGATDWEVIQFAGAELIGQRTWRLHDLLRGQAGTEGVMPSQWPVGTEFVLLDEAVAQIELPEASRGVALRPLSPVHLRARWNGGDLALSWVRRTRLGGDSWEGPDVPLGEESEAYLLRVVSGGDVLREVQVTQPAWVYDAMLRAADGTPGHFDVEVAQISTSWGAGAMTRISIDA